MLGSLSSFRARCAASEGRVRLTAVLTVVAVIGAYLALNIGIAFAHHPVLSGTTTCNTDGSWNVSWIVSNSESASYKWMRLTAASVNNGQTVTGLTINNDTSTNVPESSPNVPPAGQGSVPAQTANIPNSLSSVQLTVSGFWKWPAGQGHSAGQSGPSSTSFTVQRPSSCNAPPGSLQVTKVQVGDPGPGQGYPFTVSVNCVKSGSNVAGFPQSHQFLAAANSASNPWTLTNVPAGAVCSATEADSKGAVKSISGSVTIVTNETKAITVTNTYTPGSLQVTKVQEGAPGPGQGYPFTVSVTCTLNGQNVPGFPQSHDFLAPATSASNPWTISGIPNGSSCSASEADSKGATKTISPTSVTIASSQTKSIQVKNKYADGGKVKITKVQVGNPGPGQGYPFTVDVTCTKNGQTLPGFPQSHEFLAAASSASNPWTIEKIAEGAVCSASEPNSKGAIVSITGGVTIVTNVTKEITVTNTYTPGSLQVTKVIVGTPGPGEGYPFTVDVTCTLNGQTVPAFPQSHNFTAAAPSASNPWTVNNIPSGSSCSATETNSKGAVKSITGPVTITSSQTSSITVTNTYTPGSLQVTKSVTGVPGPDEGFPFTVSVTCTLNGQTVSDFPKNHNFTTGDPGPWVITAIPAGSSCTATETDTGDADQVNITGSPTTIVAGQQALIAVENVFIVGSLQVTKSVTGTPGPNEGYPFTVDVTCTLNGQIVASFPKSHDFTAAAPSASNPWNISNIPSGASCTAGETDDGGADSVNITGSPAVIVADQTKSIGVENVFTVGSAELTKLVTGTPGPGEGYPFTVSLTCTQNGETVPGFPQNHQFDAAAPSGTNPWTVNDIPSGASCTADETDDGGADSVNITGSPAAIVADQTKSIGVENVFGVGALEVTKTVHGEPAIGQGYPFTVDVTCTLNGQTVPGFPKTHDFTTANPGPWTITDIPADALCTATEPDSKGATTVIDPDAGVTIVSEQTREIAVSNIYPGGEAVGSVQVQKKVDGTGKPGVGSNVTYTVNVSCTDGTNVDLTFDATGGVKNVTGIDIDANTGTNCTVSEPETGGATSVSFSPQNDGKFTLTVNSPAHDIVVTNLFDPQVAGISVTRALPFTGSSSELLWKSGAWLLVIGGLLLLITRRRRKAATQGLAAA
ncbi:MAG: DUF5979 domain-containing protein [Acidimicrobiia bacterium]